MSAQQITTPLVHRRLSAGLGANHQIRIVSIIKIVLILLLQSTVTPKREKGGEGGKGANFLH